MASAPPYKVVWIASVPRTGSMWALNVARELLRAAGCLALPEIIPTEDSDMLAEGNAALHDTSPDRIWTPRTRSASRASRR